MSSTEVHPVNPRGMQPRFFFLQLLVNRIASPFRATALERSSLPRGGQFLTSASLVHVAASDSAKARIPSWVS